MEKIDRALISIMVLGLSAVFCSCGVSTEEYNRAVAEASVAQENLKTLEAEKESLAEELERVSKEYSVYKESMAEYEGLAAEEAKVRKIEAEYITESKAKEEEESRAVEQAEREAKEKAGYDTGISYSQLARTPDEYKGQKVKYKGQVLQVMEGGRNNQLRLSVHKSSYGWYDADEVLYCEYKTAIIPYRLLEKDIITIYGTAKGLFSYEAVNGETITLPFVRIDKIELEK